MDASLADTDQVSSVTLTCQLVSESTGEEIDCSVKKTEAKSQCEISYQATNAGRHLLHIKANGGYIKGSPFPVTVLRKLGTPIKTISGVIGPWGVAINQRGEIVVVESGGFNISIFSPTGDKLQSFGSHGSENGQFDEPHGVAVDRDGNILVVDTNNYRIQKFTSDGNFITAVGNKGSKHLEFDRPLGIAIHPLSNRVYVVDNRNYRIQILNPDLTFSGSFGSFGSGDGQFQGPWDVAFDSKGNAYVADFPTETILVFTAEGEYLRKFQVSKKGGGEKSLIYPSAISIDSESDVVYITECGRQHRVSVLTCEGEILTTFGTGGAGPGEFNTPCGIAVDRNGVVYVSDSSNDRLQCF
jgi:tripartite motif-containing protein 2/3/tripartite motif-containing protein 71